MNNTPSPLRKIAYISLQCTIPTYPFYRKNALLIPFNRFIIFNFFLLAVGILILSSCNLPVVENYSLSGEPNPINACFSTDPIELTCELSDCTFDFNAECSTGETSYMWDFNNIPGRIASGSLTSKSISYTFTEAGSYQVKLIVENDREMNSESKIITVSEVRMDTVKFKGVIDLGNLNVIPHGITERSHGDYHLLYFQNSSALSTIINQNNKVVGSPISLPFNGAINRTAIENGGFIISGENNTSAEIVLIDENQNIIIDEEIKFDGIATIGQGAIIDNNNELVVTGFGQSPDIFPGLGKITLSGGIINTPLINTGQILGYAGISIVHRPVNDYFIASQFLSPPGDQEAKLLHISATGNFNNTYSLAPLNFVTKIIQGPGNSYVVIGKNSSNTNYILSIDGNGAVNGQRILNADQVNDVIYNGDFIICGNKDGELYWAKFPTVTGNGYSWERSCTDTNGVTGISIDNTSDGGYIILGSFDNNGKTEAFVVKTNSSGNY